jgi:hypothetical protein
MCFLTQNPAFSKKTWLWVRDLVIGKSLHLPHFWLHQLYRSIPAFPAILSKLTGLPPVGKMQ